MKSHFVAAIAVLALTACTELKVVDVDQKTKYFPTDSKATVLTSRPFDLDSRKSLVLIPDSEFIDGMLRRTAYFDEQITLDQLENRIIAAKLGDQIPSVRDKIGMNKAAKHYKTFLWLRLERRGWARDGYMKISLTDPLTMEDLFVTETKVDQLFNNINDQHNWYPMFNSLIDYIKANSRTYRR